MSRKNRTDFELRKTRITKNYLQNPLGSVLIETGKTKVICTVMCEESVPPWLEGNEKEKGWLTARYGMLPGSGDSRIRRETKGVRGRTKEIQRLIGRSLRASLDLEVLGSRTLWVDCDVIQADGGTRTASITGSWVALFMACQRLLENAVISDSPVIRQVAATSVGLVDDKILLDICFEEDSAATVDMNVVMDTEGDFVEIQSTGEEGVFTREEHDSMLDLASQGIQELLKVQRTVLGI
ncbi:MAG: ribonuclease PH [Thermoplasmata archaeon]